MGGLEEARICAVIVTYRPELEALRALLDAVCDQVNAVLIIDNTAVEATDEWHMALLPRVTLLANPCNEGLAHAQNTGLQWARERGFSHVLLLDQDSTPGRGMVASLLNALENLQRKGVRVAAVGPSFHDQRDDSVAPFVKVLFPLSRKLYCNDPSQIIESDFLISSGMLIPMDAVAVVGPMNAGLFIDNIDLEWSFRARAKGFSLYGICAATMHHRLGDARRALPLGLGRIVVHGPVRLYYMMRNRVRLYGMPHTPGVWIAQDVPRVLVKLFLFGVLIGPRMRNLRFMMRGIRDGVRNRQGACPWS